MTESTWLESPEAEKVMTKSLIEEKYEQRQARIRAQLANIETMLDNHDKRNPDKNWGHTGDLGMVIGRLNEVTEFLGRYK